MESDRPASRPVTPSPPSGRVAQPDALPVRFEEIPAELRGCPQWVVWRFALRAGKWTKVPYRAQVPGKEAKSNDRTTWATGREAFSAYRNPEHALDGIGFMFGPDDPYCGVDLDDSLDETGTLLPWAEGIVEAISSYTEVSPSGGGVKIVLRARIRGDRRRSGKIECYDRLRYFALTGQAVGGTPGEVRERQDAFDLFYGQVFPAAKAPRQIGPRGPIPIPGGYTGPHRGPERVTVGVSASDHDLLALASAARNGDRFRRLWAGSWGPPDYESQSEADLALVSMLLFYTAGDTGRADLLFRSSGLMRAKWDEVHFAGGMTYGERTLDRALGGKHEFYSPGRGDRRETMRPSPFIPSPSPPLSLNGTGEPSNETHENPDPDPWPGREAAGRQTGPHGGQQVGANGTANGTSTPTAPPPEVLLGSVGGDSVPYVQTASGIYWLKPSPGPQGSSGVKLANLHARIVGHLLMDDGVERTRRMEVEARILSETAAFPAERFDLSMKDYLEMGWVLEQLGPEAVVEAGPGRKDHLRAAVQLLTLAEGPIPQSTVHTHTGWRRFGDGWAYLHHGGAVGAHGSRGDVSVRLPDPKLERYRLPAPPEGDDLAASVRRSLDLLTLAPARQTWPLLAMTVSAPLTLPLELDFVGWVRGATGQRKSSVIALFLSHYGAFTRHHLPASFLSTANAVEIAAFSVKDALFVVDDYAPAPDAKVLATQEAIAHRLTRGVGERRGRARATADASLRPEKYARGLVLVSAEVPPPGTQSNAARTFEVAWENESVDLMALTRLQEDERGDPMLAGAMAAYLRWLAPRMDELGTSLPGQVRRVAGGFDAEHGRVCEAAAKLLLGAALYLRFAQESGVLTLAESHLHLAELREALAACAGETGRSQIELRPTALYLDALGAMFGQKRGYLSGTDGKAPILLPSTFGYEVVPTSQGPEARTRPGAECLGWVDLDSREVYLHPTGSVHAVTRYSQEMSRRFPLQPASLGKALRGENLLLRSEADRTTGLVRIEGRPQRVWILPMEWLFPDLDLGLSLREEPAEAGESAGV